MEHKYIFSAEVPEERATLVRRKWWEFWKHDTLVETIGRRTRKSIMLTKKEGEIVLNAEGAMQTLLAKFFSQSTPPNATNVQIEEGEVATPYIKIDARDDNSVRLISYETDRLRRLLVTMDVDFAYRAGQKALERDGVITESIARRLAFYKGISAIEFEYLLEEHDD